jgi:hypothetical protein
MLKKPIFEVDNCNVIIKNEEEKLGHDDINNEVNSSKLDSKTDIKNIEAQTTKQTNTDDFSKNIFQNKDLLRFNYFSFPFNFFTSGSFLNLVREPEKEQEQNEIKEKKRGRKTERTEVSNPHNKFADDNLRKKSKHIILSEILTFLNSKLKEIYKDNIGNGILLKQLLTLNHKQKANIIVNDNKQFLQKTLQEIFSDDISKRYTNFPSDHNKNLINRLLEEDDEEKRKYFNTLFKLTFSEVLCHFQGKQIIKELVGLRTYKEALKNYETEKDYYENLKYHLTNFEEIINSKKSRRSRKQKKVEAIDEKILE